MRQTRTIMEGLIQGENLRCPSCFSEYIWHHQVKVFSRDCQDGDGICVETLNGASVFVTKNMSENPSIRRDGVLVRFSCEECGRVSKLTIAQHKGIAIIEMEVE